MKLQYFSHREAICFGKKNPENVCPKPKENYSYTDRKVSVLDVEKASKEWE
jgi:hypothetical protein